MHFIEYVTAVCHATANFSKNIITLRQWKFVRLHNMLARYGRQMMVKCITISMTKKNNFVQFTSNLQLRLAICDNLVRPLMMESTYIRTKSFANILDSKLNSLAGLFNFFIFSLGQCVTRNVLQVNKYAVVV